MAKLEIEGLLLPVSQPFNLGDEWVVDTSGRLLGKDENSPSFIGINVDGSAVSASLRLMAHDGSAISLADSALLKIDSVTAGGNMRLSPGIGGDIILANQSDTSSFVLDGSTGAFIGQQTANLIRNNADTQELTLAGGSSGASGSGAVIRIYGQSHSTQADDLILAAGSGVGRISFYEQGGERWRIESNNLVATSSAGGDIHPDTVDDSDNKMIRVSGGGDVASSRGARIEVYGNEHSTEAGRAIIKAGDTTNAEVQLYTFGAHPIRFYTAGTERARFRSDAAELEFVGNCTVSSTNGDVTIDAADDLFFNPGSTNKWVMNNNGLLYPAIDGAYNFGDPSFRINEVFVDSGFSCQAGSNPEGRFFTGSTTIAIEMTKSGNADFSFNNSSGTERILLGGSAIHSTFTATHKYEIGTSNPQEGDAVKLVNRKLEKCTTDGDPTCVGLMTSETVTTGTPDPDNADSYVKAVIYDSFGTAFDHAVGGPHTLHHVASLGDSYTDFLIGAKVCDDGGAVSAGDLLETCAAKPGFLRKQSDDIIRAKTVAQAIEDVTFDGSGEATGVYVYLKK